ncbi:EPSP synthase family protein [[Clostridium] bifermentans ATCC 19299]|uniref:UDP-N-acetylglucosamine 1-carboxyvinyltransferase n=1 Tax=Paraclostridium bifermentans TaxID=1490 RepID=UPI00038C8737|nr:UDP-N-acetylglucosamine 1-carboxyvinyltransferase [Paraclostridium bifermentans]EQK41155.1 EPSP synthase family protein [[Clostridium] bifermentans ATCC 19299] [Paraclostridium bifermentans ATCC 19299]
MKKIISVPGGIKINGKFQSGGSKNSVLFLICASLLFDDEVVIFNVPNIYDVDILLSLIKKMNVDIEYTKEKKEIKIYNQKNIINYLDVELAQKLRGSIALLCPLIYRFKSIKIPFPGGDKIGNRSIDELLRALNLMGATTEIHDDCYIIKRHDKLKAFNINLKCKSHTVTMCLIMLASIIDDNCIVKNYSLEPEIKDLIKMMINAGVSIKTRDKTSISICNNGKLKSTYIETMPDRTEIASYVIAALATGGQIHLTKKDFLALDPTFIEIIKDIGANIQVNFENIIISGKDEYNCFFLSTGPYPEFHSDLQSIFIPLSNKCKGICSLTETMFENRFNQNEDFEKLGYNLKLNNNKLCIYPSLKTNKNTHVYCKDIRGGFALIVAALQLSKDTTTDLNNVEVIERGYENLLYKFKLLGVNFQIKEEN